MGEVVLARPRAAMVDQTHAQRLAALERANAVRTSRARLKKQLKRGERRAQEVLIDPPACVLGVRVIEFLTWLPRLGRVRGRNVLRQMSEERAATSSLEQFGERRRLILAALLP